MYLLCFSRNEMVVSELIEKLQQVDPQATVVLVDLDGYPSHTMEPVPNMKYSPGYDEILSEGELKELEDVIKVDWLDGSTDAVALYME